IYRRAFAGDRQSTARRLAIHRSASPGNHQGGVSAADSEPSAIKALERESLRAICADAGMPDRATVSRWLARYEEFHDLYGFARECQAECLVDEILEIARDSSRDYVKKVGVDGKVTWVVDREHIARCGLRISALKWTAARMAPRKYGNARR